ncbi:MAG: two-component system sensor histidine kinase EnvZ [Pseudomonadota bacterium]
MRLLPKSTFGRIAMLIGGLLLINQFISYYSVTIYIVQPFVRQVMHLVAMQVKIHALDQSVDLSPELGEAYKEATGIEAMNSVAANARGLGDAVLYKTLTDELNRQLDGPAPSEVRIEESDGLFFWVKSPYKEDVWLRVPMPLFDAVYPPPLVIYLSVISLLSLLGGWVFARQISRPLRRLEFAARELGRGDAPGTLKETGTQELVAVTRSFNQMARNIHQLEQDRTMLLAGISHDLRTPLTRIRLSTEFLPDEYEELREGIIRDTEDMDEIIAQFISFVRDGRDERSEPGDLNALARAAGEAAAINHGDVRFELGDIPPVPFKALAMKRLVRNLIENALRYAGPPVTIRTKTEDTYVVLSVLDEGPGINENDIPRLFQPFTRGDSARGGRGSGLGLAIVKRIAEMHKARISLHNRPEGGLEARLRIPYV